MSLFKRLHGSRNDHCFGSLHLMDDVVANFAGYTVYVMEKGERLVKAEASARVFQDIAFMESIQLGVPKIYKIRTRIQKIGLTFPHFISL